MVGRLPRFGSAPVDDGEIVAVNDLGVGRRAEYLRDPLRPQADDSPQVGGGVVDESSGEDLAVVVGEGHHVARGEVAVE